MNAIRIHKPGELADLKLEAIPNPALTEPDQVLVRLHSTNISAIDADLALERRTRLSLPATIGADGAGIVAAVGAKSNGIQVGDKVVVFPYVTCGTCPSCRSGAPGKCTATHIISEAEDGTFAEYITLPARNCVPKPDNLSLAESGAFALTFTIVWRLLVTFAALKPGESLLIVGVSGGVGTAALQVANAIGAKIFVTSRDIRKIDSAKRLGALDGTLTMPSELARSVRTMTNKRGVDAVLNCVGGDTWGPSLATLAKGGRLLTCGQVAETMPRSDLRRIFWNNLRVFGASNGTLDDFKQVIRCMEYSGKRPIVEKVFPLHEVNKALAYRERYGRFGQIVLQIDGS